MDHLAGRHLGLDRVQEAHELLMAVALHVAPTEHPKVRAWLDRHERFVFHFTPTSCSWLNAVEGFFARLSRCRLKRGVFRSVVDLQAAINRFLAETNAEPKPLHMDRRPRQNHRRRQTRAPSVQIPSQLVCPPRVSPWLLIERTAMTRTHFAEGQVLFREGDPPDCVFRVLSGAVDVLREIDGEPILLGTVGAGEFLGEMGVVENRSRSATARAASEVEVEIFTPTELFDQIAGSPQAARELIQRLSQRLREADDRIVKDERRSGRPHETPTDADSPTALVPANNPYLAAKDPWLQRQFDAKLALTDLPFVVGRGPVAREGGPPLHPNLKLDDTVPFRLSRNHFMIERRDRSYYVHDLRSTLGTIVNGQPIGQHFRSDDAPLRAGENEVIAGGVDSRFVFSVLIA